jgi:membrane protein DedA with SNARE-associated domain
MPEALSFLVRHGYAWLFAVVFLEQLGAPLPATPLLLAMGALLARDDFSFAGALGVTALAAGLADHVWFQVGRRRGQAALRFLCRVSLEPDNCVSNTRYWFRRLGGWALLLAKFFPGLNAVAVPVAATSRMPLARFAALELGGTLLWATTLLGLGYAFRAQLEALAAWAFRISSSAALVLGVPLAAYLGFKYWQRRRFLKNLKIARLLPERLREMIAAGEPVFLLDLRHPDELAADRAKLPGAVWLDRRELASRHTEIPRDRDVILYCS